MSQFAADTRLEALTEGRFRGVLSSNWNIADNPNGGYMVAMVLRALAGLNPAHPDPLSVTTHFLRPGVPGAECEVHTQLVRTGRTLSTVRAQLVQEGKARLELLAAFGDLASAATAAESSTPITLSAPALPPPEQCPMRSGTAQGVNLPILNRLEIRVNPADAASGELSGRAEVSGWIRLGDGAAGDSISAVMFTDAFPPALFGLLGVIGWVPTIELTVHVRRRPATPWLLGRFITDDLQGGRMIESGALWDEDGHLVAQSRQLGLLLSAND